MVRLRAFRAASSVDALAKSLMARDAISSYRLGLTGVGLTGQRIMDRMGHHRLTSCKQDGWLSPHALCNVHPSLDRFTKDRWVGCQVGCQNCFFPKQAGAGHECGLSVG